MSLCEARFFPITAITAITSTDSPFPHHSNFGINTDVHSFRGPGYPLEDKLGLGKPTENPYVPLTYTNLERSNYSLIAVLLFSGYFSTYSARRDPSRLAIESTP